jgi:glycosyltransferase involved in cell wall biosynthesis
MTSEAASIPIARQSGQTAPKSICVCILTYQRPARLRAALESVQAQTLVGHEDFLITGLVVDNDSKRSGEATVLAFENAPIPFRYVVEESRGVVCGRNRILDEAGNSDFLAVFDDDEIATPQWLERLLWAQQTFHADVVTGPVDSVLEDAPAWVSKGGFFAPRRYPTGSHPAFVETNNFLLSGALARRYRFEMQFNQTGGEDTYFFNQISRGGGVIAWCEEARVNEVVSSQRTNAEWLIDRERSNANRLARCRLIESPGIASVSERLAKGVASLSIGVLLLLTSFGSTSRAVRGRQRIGRFLGTLAAVRGKSHIYYKSDTPLS